MPRPAQPITLYRFTLSGHAHRAQLMLSLLDLPYRLVDIDLMRGEQKAASFVERNLFGQVPVIEDGDFTLADSNAILIYLALAYDADRRWLPADVRVQAEVQRWLGAAAGPLVRGPAVARWQRISGQGDGVALHAASHQLFARLEGHLQQRDWFVGEAPTIADVALYSYTARAPEGGIPLDDYPRLRAWLARVEALPGFVAMPVAAP
ncbi:glutathione S-transferase family protein [Aquincola sp. S2]|uniref:Glutathione S-transferase family protein n=1 Tax=Pseudaquabacterium terrae TaxID=2732868 RepID=A0ABX2ENI1_9BURK|nr:glutathione S-transferase [Aquabacterium terrae]NRF70124.1 glutathione S-transferase family protein [Aquabacterium terrae]